MEIVMISWALKGCVCTLCIAWYPPHPRVQREAAISTYTDMAVGRNQWYHVGVGEFTTHFRTYFSGSIV